MQNFQVNTSHCQTSENTAIPLDMTSSTFDQKGSENINAYTSEGRLVMFQSAGREISHLLLTRGCLPTSASKTAAQHSTHFLSTANDPISPPHHGECMLTTCMGKHLMNRTNDETRYMMFREQNLSSVLILQWRSSVASYDSQQSSVVHLYSGLDFLRHMVWSDFNDAYSSWKHN